MKKLIKSVITETKKRWYVVGSVIVGTLLSITSFGYRTGNSNYCDVSLLRSDQQFGVAELFSKSLTSLLFIINICELVSIIMRYRNGSIDKIGLLLKGMLMSVLVYVIVLMISNIGYHEC